MPQKAKKLRAIKSVPSGQFDILNNLLVELKDGTKCGVVLTEKELNRVICSMRYCDWSTNHELIDGLTQLGEAAFGKRLGNFSECPRMDSTQ